MRKKEHGNRLWGALALACGALAQPSAVWAAGGGEDGPIPSFLNIYGLVAHAFGLGKAAYPLLSGVFALIVLTVLGLHYRAYVRQSLLQNQVAPRGKFSIVSLVEACLDFLYTLSSELFGKTWIGGMALMSALFLFILVMNLSGLFPFLPPGSGDFSANLGMGIAVFLVYNIAGVQEHGWKRYLRHFAGPKVPIPVIGLLLPVLIFVIELISHSFRPVSLSLRLMGNIFGDHMLVGVFTGMVYWVVPSILLFFGVLVSIVQAFVFSLLSGIYLALAISHDH